MIGARLSRREFLAATGGLVLSFSIPATAFAQEGKSPNLPGSLSKAPFLDSWIRIDEKGDATVFTGKAELGQGIKTALVQLAAEELVLDPQRITLVTVTRTMTR